jgi:hypothetical protein
MEDLKVSHTLGGSGEGERDEEKDERFESVRVRVRS